MDQSLLVTEQIRAGEKFLQEFNKYAPVDVAFWLRRGDDFAANLYVVSDQINANNMRAANFELLRIANVIQDPNFDTSRIRFVSRSDRAAQAALATINMYRSPIPFHQAGGFFGGATAEEVYIYPPLPAPAVS
ncbi:MAG: hypothetical protein HY000_30825 [Planctomycetes bacterium]|nr:hypothetical protein [Planctomycetota bacterium]